jgi:hypothetical protein
VEVIRRVVTGSLFDTSIHHHSLYRMQMANMMTLGNFALEGNSSYHRRKVVLSVPNGNMTGSSHVPLPFMEVYKPPALEVVIGVLKKIRRKRTGQKKFHFFSDSISCTSNFK